MNSEGFSQDALTWEGSHEVHSCPSAGKMPDQGGKGRSPACASALDNAFSQLVSIRLAAHVEGCHCKAIAVLRLGPATALCALTPWRCNCLSHRLKLLLEDNVPTWKQTGSEGQHYRRRPWCPGERPETAFRALGRGQL